MYKCKECLIEKDLSMFYKHPQTKDWISHRCKECMLKWRKTEHELSLSRIRDKRRYLENPRRRLYSVYRWMYSRCYDPSNSHYKNYWWRWIKVERDSFDKFYNDMIDDYINHGKSYWYDSKNCQIDRIDNDMNYWPSNCRFITSSENSNNRRDNVKYYWKWKYCTISNILQQEKKDIKYATVRCRIKRWWNIEKAINFKNKI